MVGGHGIRLGLSLVLMIASARVLGPENFGLYSALIALVWIFQGLASFGLQTPLAQRLVQSPDQEPSLLGAATLLHSLTIAVSAIAYLALLFGQYEDSAQAILGGILLLPVLAFPLAENLNQALVAKQKTALSASYMLAAFLVGAVFVLWAIYQQSFKMFLLAFMVEFVVLGVLLVLFHRRNEGRFPDLNAGFELVLPLARQSFPLFVSVGIQLLHQRLSVVMVERLSGPEEAGIYAAAMRVVALVGTLMVILTTPFFATLSAHFFHRPERFERTLGQQLDALAGLALVGCGLLILSSPWLMGGLFGAGFADASLLILPLALASYLFCLRPIYDRVINLWEKPWYETLSYGVLLLSLALFSFWLIPVAGASGAAWAYLLSVIAGQYLILLYGRENRRFLRAQVLALIMPLRWVFGRSRGPLAAFRKENEIV